jgi:high-affinity iron transporter
MSRKDGAGVGGATPNLADAARITTKHDADLFDTVTKGRPGTGMPAWGSILNERDRWNVVAYIRTFAAPP